MFYYTLYLWNYPIFAFARISEVINASLFFKFILGIVIILAIITLIIFLPPYLEKKQKQRDRSLGCLQYRQMLTESEKSYALNPNGKKWVRESMAAEGLRKDFGCTDINKK